MKNGFFMSAALCLVGFASEVGASNLQSTTVVPNWVVVADAGAMDSWTTFSSTQAIEPSSRMSNASHLDSRIKDLGQKLNKEIDARVAEQLQHAFESKASH